MARPKPGRAPVAHFVNPYPQMSEVEARVHLFLEGIGVPFSWRKFDGAALAPNFTWLMPSFHPEFTLTEYKVAILIIGTYWGSLPGLLDTNGLAAALLESDGWKVAVLWEFDVIADTEGAVIKAVPELAAAAIKGRPKQDPSTYGLSYLSRMRDMARNLSFKKRVWLRQGDWSSRDPEKRSPTPSNRREDRRIKRRTPTNNDAETSKFNGKAVSATSTRKWRNRFATPSYLKEQDK